MKYLYTALVIGLLYAPSTFGQPDDRPPHMHGNSPMQYDEGTPPPPLSPLHQVMNDLREKNPSEFDRLQSLRKTNPSAFREEARLLMRSTALEKLEQSRPEIHRAIQGLSPDDQEWLFDMMFKSKLFDHGKKPSGKPFRTSEREERQQIRQLIRLHKQSESAEEKAALADQLRAVLSEQYDQHLASRGEQLADMEAKLDQARAQLAEGEEEKAAFIEQRLNAMLDYDRKGQRRRFSPETESPQPE